MAAERIWYERNDGSDNGKKHRSAVAAPQEREGRTACHEWGVAGTVDRTVKCKIEGTGACKKVRNDEQYYCYIREVPVIISRAVTWNENVPGQCQGRRSARKSGERLRDSATNFGCVRFLSPHLLFDILSAVCLRGIMNVRYQLVSPDSGVSSVGVESRVFLRPERVSYRLAWYGLAGRDTGGGRTVRERDGGIDRERKEKNIEHRKIQRVKLPGIHDMDTPRDHQDTAGHAGPPQPRGLSNKNDRGNSVKDGAFFRPSPRPGLGPRRVLDFGAGCGVPSGGVSGITPLLPALEVGGDSDMTATVTETETFDTEATNQLEKIPQREGDGTASPPSETSTSTSASLAMNKPDPGSRGTSEKTKIDGTLVHRSFVTEEYVRDKIRETGMAVKLSAYVSSDEVNENLIVVKMCPNAKGEGRSQGPTDPEWVQDRERRLEQEEDPRKTGGCDDRRSRPRERRRVKVKREKREKTGKRSRSERDRRNRRRGREDRRDTSPSSPETLRTGPETEPELQPDAAEVQMEPGAAGGGAGGGDGDNVENGNMAGNTTMNESQDLHNSYRTRSKGPPWSEGRRSSASSRASSTPKHKGLKDSWADRSVGGEEDGANTTGKKNKREQEMKRQRRSRERLQLKNRDWSSRSAGTQVLPALGEEPIPTLQNGVNQTEQHSGQGQVAGHP